MWLSDRRGVLLGALALAGCGFEPVYAPSGAGGALLNAITLPAPKTENAYVFNRRFEERLGRAGAAPYTLSLRLQTDTRDLGTTSTGAITRYRLIGRAIYELRETGGETALISGRTNAFTGYSTTGSTVATLAAERDAASRLMVLLADQVIDALLLEADTLPR